MRTMGGSRPANSLNPPPWNEHPGAQLPKAAAMQDCPDQAKSLGGPETWARYCLILVLSIMLERAREEPLRMLLWVSFPCFESCLSLTEETEELSAEEHPLWSITARIRVNILPLQKDSNEVKRKQLLTSHAVSYFLETSVL